MKTLDKVSEAYYGELGEQFARKTRERIHWICSKAQGSNVLDVGCSQGIAAVLLAREGKKVVGIDIEEDAISYAKNAILNESTTVKNNVQYHACSIFDFEADHKFDSIILAEVIEHFSSPITLLQKVTELLMDDGTLIITVPFGINDFIDHKKTYYLFNLLEEIEPLFYLKEVKFFGKWIGLVVGSNSDASKVNEQLKSSLVNQLEDAFYNLERSLIDDINNKNNHIKKINSQIVDYQAKVNSLHKENELLKKENEEMKKKATIEPHQEQISQINHMNEQLKLQIDKLQIELKALNHQGKELKAEARAVDERYSVLLDDNSTVSTLENEINDLQEVIKSKNKEILNRVESESTTLKKYKDMIVKYNQLEAKNIQVTKKYDLLSKAKLGRLTLKYWKFRNRIPEDF